MKGSFEVNFGGTRVTLSVKVNKKEVRLSSGVLKIDVWAFYAISAWVYSLVCSALLLPQGEITLPDKHKREQ